jgi:hypothetical protein
VAGCTTTGVKLENQELTLASKGRLAPGKRPYSAAAANGGVLVSPVADSIACLVPVTAFERRQLDAIKAELDADYQASIGRPPAAPQPKISSTHQP